MRRVYDPFGDPAAATGSTNPTVGFQGDYTDPASGEVWMGARWYSPADAAFRSRDTMSGELSTPISLNRYTYGWANPLRYWDPDGHMVLETDDMPTTRTHAPPTRPATAPRSGSGTTAAAGGVDFDRSTATPQTATEGWYEAFIAAEGRSVAILPQVKQAIGSPECALMWGYGCGPRANRPRIEDLLGHQLDDAGPAGESTTSSSWTSDFREDVVSFAEGASIALGGTELGATGLTWAGLAAGNPIGALPSAAVASGANVAGTIFDAVVATDSVYAAAFEGGDRKKAFVDFTAVAIGFIIPVSGRLVVKSAQDIGEPVLEWAARTAMSKVASAVDLIRADKWGLNPRGSG